MFDSRIETCNPGSKKEPVGFSCKARGSCPAQPRPSGLTIVAHDLRGPLSSLRLLVEAMGTRASVQDDAKIASYSSRAECILDGLDTLLNSILERVRENGDPLALKPEAINMVDLIDDAIALNAPRAREKSVRLHTMTKGRCDIRGDRQLLLQVLDNLIGNAIKHSPLKGNVTCLNDWRGSEVFVSIMDEGPGMAPADLKRAFGPFTKLSAMAADDSRSWGLGLWIAKLIVSQHGGNIEIQSRGNGRGTEFRVSLPWDIPI